MRVLKGIGLIISTIVMYAFIIALGIGALAVVAYILTLVIKWAWGA